MPYSLIPLSRCVRSRGFTLIELISVVAVVAILATLLVPIISGVREKAQMAQSIARLRAIGGALQAYGGENGGIFLPAKNDGANRWHILLVPYLNENLAVAFERREINSDELINSGYFKCPSMEAATEGRNNGAYAYNRELEVTTGENAIPATRMGDLSSPSTFPVMTTSGVAGGPRLFASNYGNLAPTAAARAHGYSGATNEWGPNPNFGENALFLFGDWHVEARNICKRTLWPWNDPAAFKVR